MGQSYSNLGDVWTSLGPQELLYIEYVAAIWLVYASINYGYGSYRYQANINSGKNRRMLRDAKKFRIPEVSDEKTRKILNAADTGVLRDMQIKGEVSSLEIVAVYAKRCHTIGRSLNLVTEEYYDEAFKMAA